MQETSLLSAIKDRVASGLPSYWDVDVALETSEGDREVDAVVTVRAPDGQWAAFAVEAKSAVRDAAGLMWQLEDLRRATGLDVLLVTPYANAALRAACEQRGFSYVDTTGWLRLETKIPPLFVSRQGSGRSPGPTRSSDISRLSGAGASRVVRALLESRPPTGVRELAGVAQVSPGSVAKLLPTLTTAGAVERDERGAVTRVRRRILLMRWVQDYSFARSNFEVGWWVAPRGLSRTVEQASSLGLVATGSLVTRRWLPTGLMSVTPLALAAFYAADPSGAAEQLRLVQAPKGQADVAIARPRDASLLSPTGSSWPGSMDAPLPQALADLLTLPGRSVEEAEQIMDLLAEQDPSWSKDPS